MSDRVLFRFDASSQLGGGHAYRCLTLANALQVIGYEIIIAASDDTFKTVLETNNFATVRLDNSSNESEFIGQQVGRVNLLVVDHYELDADFEKRSRQWASKILVIDDLADRAHDCDYLLDQTLGRIEADYRMYISGHCQCLLGPDYALLRPQFLVQRTQHREKSVKSIENIFISYGVNDPDNLTLRTLLGIMDTGFDGHVTSSLAITHPI